MPAFRSFIFRPKICVGAISVNLGMSDAPAGGPSDDGLFPRFQILVWPDHPKEWKLVDRPPRAASVATAEGIFSAALPEPFSSRDVYLKSWSGLSTPEEARTALGVLERHAWVAKVRQESMAVGGRPSEMWAINPRIVRGRYWEQLLR